MLRCLRQRRVYSRGKDGWGVLAGCSSLKLVVEVWNSFGQRCSAEKRGQLKLGELLYTAASVTAASVVPHGWSSLVCNAEAVTGVSTLPTAIVLVAKK
jgi:hypothetical protein